MQMVIAEADVPSLSKGSQTGAVDYVTYATPGLVEEIVSLVRLKDTIPWTEHVRKVQRIWGSACDALLGDKAIMSWVQV